MSEYNYPNIKQTRKGDLLSFETTIRIKRDGLWYEKTAKEDYRLTPNDGKSDIAIFSNLFFKILIIYKCYWKVGKTTSMNKNITISKNQEDTTDDLVRNRDYFLDNAPLLRPINESMSYPYDALGKVQQPINNL